MHTVTDALIFWRGLSVPLRLTAPVPIRLIEKMTPARINPKPGSGVWNVGYGSDGYVGS